MAYNITTTNVKETQDSLSQNMLDKESDQEISGAKTFLNNISANQFKLLDGTPLRPTALETISNNTPGAILICNGDTTATGALNLTYKNSTLSGQEATFEVFNGSAKKLTEIPADALEGTVPPTTLPLGSRGGLSVHNNQLIIDPTTPLSIRTQGQTLADPDLLLIYDVSKNELRKTTLQVLHDDYLHSKLKHPGGQVNSLQFKKGTGFGGSAGLTFNPTKQILNVDGHCDMISLATTNGLTVGGPLHQAGALHQAIKTITGADYTVQQDDYTLLADVSNTSICVTLPDAAQNEGRVINIKGINSAKYTLRSHSLVIKSAGGSLDRFDDITLKMNGSSRTLQSDGTNWWIIGTKGT